MIPAILEADDIHFPDAHFALIEPNGLLAIGGDLSSERLINAYKHGIFPWYSEGEPILWWSPDPRAILFPKKIRISHSLKKTMNKVDITTTWDKAFNQVITACAAPRPKQQETWITTAMIAAYSRLHELGVTHSLEVWQGEELIGGLYGLAIGKVFFGESMFNRKSDASKIAFVTLAQQLDQLGFELIDCQLPNLHLLTMGAEEISRRAFLELLEKHIQGPNLL